jgi:hypothetical protein
MFHFVGDHKVTSSFLEDELGKLLVFYLGEYDRYQCFRRTCCLPLQLLPTFYGILTFAICLRFDRKSCFIGEILVYKN